MAAKGEAVQKGAALFEKRSGDSIADDDAAKWGVAAGDALREGDHVGLIVEALATEPMPKSAERTDHFVADE